MKAVAPTKTVEPSGGHDTRPASRTRTIIEFPAGIPGFESCRRFVLVVVRRAGAARLPAVARSARGVVSHRRSGAARSALRPDAARIRTGAPRRRRRRAAGLAGDRHGPRRQRHREPARAGGHQSAPHGRLSVHSRRPRLSGRLPARQGAEPVLVVTRKRNEAIVIGDGIEVRVLRHGRDGVRLGITAPPHVAVHRQEIYDTIRAANASAAVGPAAVAGPRRAAAGAVRQP